MLTSIVFQCRLAEAVFSTSNRSTQYKHCTRRLCRGSEVCYQQTATSVECAARVFSGMGNLTMVWHSYYTLIFTGLTCLSVWSTNSAWWCTNDKMAQLYNRIWRYTGHQTLRLHHGSIFILPPAINWQFRHIGGLHMVVGHLLSLDRQHGTHCLTRPF